MQSNGEIRTPQSLSRNHALLNCSNCSMHIQENVAFFRTAAFETCGVESGCEMLNVWIVDMAGV